MLIHVSVVQNLRLGTPLALQHELISVLDELCLRQVVENLPDGVNTRLKAAVQSSLPTGFVKVFDRDIIALSNSGQSNLAGSSSKRTLGYALESR